LKLLVDVGLSDPKRDAFGRSACHSHDGVIYGIHPNLAFDQVFTLHFGRNMHDITAAAILLPGAGHAEFVVFRGYARIPCMRPAGFGFGVEQLA